MSPKILEKGAFDLERVRDCDERAAESARTQGRIEQAHQIGRQTRSNDARATTQASGMIETIAPFVELGGLAIVIGATLYLRAAIVSFNKDLRSILTYQGVMSRDLAVAFETTKASIDGLEKRVKVLEDEVL
jgi:hypothetical protein